MVLEANRSIWMTETQVRSSYPLLSLLRHYAPSIRGSRTACTFQMWQCKLYTYTIDVLALMSSRDLEQRDLIISIDTPRNQHVQFLQIIFIFLFVYLYLKNKIFYYKIINGEKTNTLTLPQAGQRPASFPLFAASCMLDVTSPWDPNKCLSKPYLKKEYVKISYNIFKCMNFVINSNDQTVWNLFNLSY